MRICCLLIPLILLAEARSEVVYTVSFPNAAHHEAEIAVTFENVDNETLRFRMSQSSPGRYANHNFGKNVYNVAAVDGAGQALIVERTAPSIWEAGGHDGTVTVTYTLYADWVDGTYSGIDLTHAHLNMPATFLWAFGFEDEPVRIHFHPASDDWKVATQLVRTNSEFTFTAPNLQYFLDSPTELSNFSMRSWQVGEGDEAQTIRLAVHHLGTEEDVDELARMTRKVVEEQRQIFGELPRFDFGEYVFICDYLPWADGDGMEHRNSTIVTNSESLHDLEFKRQLGTISHEFIHVWNVERLRPARLEPFDFERPNLSNNLWFAEGFTSYYGNLAIFRAGESDIDDLLDHLAGVTNAVVNSSGRRFASPIGMSSNAAFVDDATSIDPDNFRNTHISYYRYGSFLAAMLDLTLRRDHKLTLDDYMRALWKQFGVAEVPFDTDDLQSTLADLTGDADFAADFFQRYVQRSAIPDYRALFESVGIVVRPANRGSAWLGVSDLHFNGPEALIPENTPISSPLYEAGLDRGDRILSIDRYELRSETQWQRVVDRYRPGDKATIRYLQRGVEREALLTFTSDPTLELVTVESTGDKPSRAERSRRAAWLN